MKKMGFADKFIFILGVSLAGFFAFVLVAGVIVALIKYYWDSKKQPAETRSIHALDEPVAQLIANPFEHKLAEAAQLHDDVLTGQTERIQEAYRLFERLRKEYPGRAIFKAYHGSIVMLLANAEDNASERRKLTNRGLKLLDEAAKASPQEAAILQLRSLHVSRP